MPFIDWLPSYNIGISEIDIDNQQLVSMINLLHESITKKNNQETVNQVICQLAQNYQDHCKVTSKLFEELKYPAESQQQESHKKFGRVLATYLQRLKKEDTISAMELIGFLRNWFENHVLLEDQQIKAFLKIKKNQPISDDNIANSHIKPIEWSELYNFHLGETDKQHKFLADLYNKLYRAVELKMSREIILKIMNTFKHHAIKHFKSEENLMSSLQYDKLEEHAKIHRQLLQDFENLIVRISDNNSITYLYVLEYIKNWLLNHFAKADKQFYDFAKQQKALTNQA